MEDNIQRKSIDTALNSPDPIPQNLGSTQTPETDPREREEGFVPSQNQNSVTNTDQESSSEQINPPTHVSSSHTPISPKNHEHEKEKDRPEFTLYSRKESIEQALGKLIILILGGQGVGKSTLLNALLNISNLIYYHNGYKLIDPSNPESPPIGQHGKGAGTIYAQLYESNNFPLPLLDTAGYLDEVMNILKKISSYTILDLYVRKAGAVKIVLVVNFETVGKLTALLRDEVKILRQIINIPDVEILLAVNKYIGDEEFFGMDDVEKVKTANADILEAMKTVLESCEEEIISTIKKILEYHNKYCGVKTFKGMIQAYEDVIQTNPQIQETLDKVKEFEGTKDKIKDICFLYFFYKQIIEKNNFQYYDIRNTPAMEMLKEKMLGLNTIPKENLVFYGNTSPILSHLQDYLNDYFKKTLPLVKRYIFKRLYPLDTLNNYLQELHEFLEDSDNGISKEINQLNQDLSTTEGGLQKDKEDKKTLLNDGKEEVFDEIEFSDHSKFYPEVLVERETKYPIMHFEEELYNEDTRRVELHYKEGGKTFKAFYKSSKWYSWLKIFTRETPCKGKVKLFTSPELLHADELKNLDDQIASKQASIKNINEMKGNREVLLRQKNEDLSLLREIISDVQNTDTQYDEHHLERDQYLLNIFEEVSCSLSGHVALFQNYIQRLRGQFNFSMRILENDYQDLIKRGLDDVKVHELQRPGDIKAFIDVIKSWGLEGEIKPEKLEELFSEMNRRNETPREVTEALIMAGQDEEKAARSLYQEYRILERVEELIGILRVNHSNDETPLESNGSAEEHPSEENLALKNSEVTVHQLQKPGDMKALIEIIKNWGPGPMDLKLMIVIVHMNDRGINADVTKALIMAGRENEMAARIYQANGILERVNGLIDIISCQNRGSQRK